MKKSFLIILVIINCLYSLGQVKDINLKITGLSEEYATKFKAKKQEIIDQLNDISLPSSINPVTVEVNYKNNEGWVTMSINYNHIDFFSLYENSSHNDNWRETGDGISFLFISNLITVLTVYKFEVIRDKGLIDEELSKFKSCIKLQSGANYVKIFAWNYLGDPYNGGAYPSQFYKNIIIFYEGKEYNIETINPQALNDMNFFYIGNKIGLDGKKNGNYYFSKFFKLDEWISASQRKEKMEIEEAARKKELEKQEEIEFRKNVINSSDYIYLKKLTNKDTINLTIQPNILSIYYDYFMFFKEKFPNDYQDKVDTYQRNIQFAESRGLKPEDYSTFTLFLYFDSNGKLERIENAFLKGFTNSDIPSNYVSQIDKYINLNTPAYVILDGKKYYVKTSFNQHFAINEETQKKNTIYLRKDKKGNILVESNIEEDLKQLLINNSQVSQLEKGRYQVTFESSTLDLRLRYFQNYIRKETIQDKKKSLKILGINSL